MSPHARTWRRWRSLVLLEQLCDPPGALGRVVVDELQLRRVLHPQLAPDAPLQVAVRGVQRLQGAPALSGVAEDRHEYARMAEIWRCLDSGHGDESDPR